MLHRIDQTIAGHHLIPDGTHTLIAVSGGADSVFLLHALKGLAPAHDWRFTVAHLDHGLRGTQGSDDAAFVRELAKTLHVDCICEHADVRSLAGHHRQSIEMAGRKARHDFYHRVSRERRIDQVATGHTADDRIETLLLNLARGTGMEGLASIPYRAAPRNGLRLVRPLLDVGRTDIEIWMREHHHPWRIDPSNRDPVYRRNRVRHELLPWLESRLNPGIRGALLRLIRQATRDREWIEVTAADATRKCTVEPLGGETGDAPFPRWPALDRDRLLAYPAALRHRIIRNWLYRLRIPAPRIDQATIETLDRMAAGNGPERTVLAGNTPIACHHERLECVHPVPSPAGVDPREWVLPIQDHASIEVDDPGFRITVTHETGSFRREGGRTPGLFPAQCTIRMPDATEAPLIIRFWKPGDRLRPTGRSGSRKIHDILTDARVPARERARIPLVVHDRNVIWLPGYRISQDWRVTNPDVPRLRIHIERREPRQKN